MIIILQNFHRSITSHPTPSIINIHLSTEGNNKYSKCLITFLRVSQLLIFCWAIEWYLLLLFKLQYSFFCSHWGFHFIFEYVHGENSQKINHTYFICSLIISHFLLPVYSSRREMHVISKNSRPAHTFICSFRNLGSDCIESYHWKLLLKYDDDKLHCTQKSVISA